MTATNHLRHVARVVPVTQALSSDKMTSVEMRLGEVRIVMVNAPQQRTAGLRD